MEKVHIIDGNNYYMRMYFKGNAENHLIFSKLAMKLQGLKGRVIFAFDTCKSARRLEIYPEYKGGRKSSLSEEEYKKFKESMALFQRIMKYTGYTVLEGNGYEADDYVAMITKLLKRYHVYIYSTDGDFWQLVSDRVTVIKEWHETITTVTPDSFLELAGVPQEFFVDWKCMVGDTSDNIIGIKGIGKGKATTFINDIGSYEEIRKASQEKDKPNKTDEKIIDGKESFLLAKSLIDLTEVYGDKRLRALVKEKVSNTGVDRERILKIIATHDMEECQEIVNTIVKMKR